MPLSRGQVEEGGQHRWPEVLSFQTSCNGGSNRSILSLIRNIVILCSVSFIFASSSISGEKVLRLGVGRLRVMP